MEESRSDLLGICNDDTVVPHLGLVVIERR